MLRVLLIVIVIFPFFSILAQKKKNSNPLSPIKYFDPEAEERNRECVRKNIYNAPQRLKFYPFSKASEIKIVSFDVKPEPNGEVFLMGNEIPKENDTICFNKLDENITLSKVQVDSLTDILYNYVNKGKVWRIIGSGCFNPRNAIVFADSSGKGFEYIEVCFECGGNRASSDKVITGDFCEGKIGLLKAFFIKIGIEIGTIKGTAFQKDD